MGAAERGRRGRPAPHPGGRMESRSYGGGLAQPSDPQRGSADGAYATDGGIGRKGGVDWPPLSEAATHLMPWLRHYREGLTQAPIPCPEVLLALKPEQDAATQQAAMEDAYLACLAPAPNCTAQPMSLSELALRRHPADRCALARGGRGSGDTHPASEAGPIVTAPRVLDAATLPLQGRHLIEASAGTGKTHTLTDLYLRLVVEAGRAVEQILVVTFTKAATAEMKARIRRRLLQAHDEFHRRLSARRCGGTRLVGRRRRPRPVRSAAGRGADGF